MIKAKYKIEQSFYKFPSISLHCYSWKTILLRSCSVLRMWCVGCDVSICRLCIATSYGQGRWSEPCWTDVAVKRLVKRRGRSERSVVLMINGCNMAPVTQQNQSILLSCGTLEGQWETMNLVMEWQKSRGGGFWGWWGDNLIHVSRVSIIGLHPKWHPFPPT